MTLISIDPGVTGAIAVWRPGQLPIVSDIDLSDLDQLAWQLNLSEPATVALERTHARPITGSIGNFQQGETRGIIRGICAAFGHQVVDVLPQQWKLDMHLIGEDKEASRLAALKMWPDLEERLCLKKHHNRAEALLIGYWYQHITKGEPTQ